MAFFLMGSGCSEEKGLVKTRVSRGRVPNPSTGVLESSGELGGRYLPHISHCLTAGSPL